MTFDDWAKTYFSEGLVAPAGFRDAWDAARKAEREVCIAAIEAEKVDADDTRADEDEAYNTALVHAVAAISALPIN